MQQISNLLNALFDWSSLTPTEKAEIFHGTVILFSSLLGIIFLAWRSISTDKLARAALKQAKVAAGQLELSSSQLRNQTEQTENVRKQVEILAKSTELTAKAQEETSTNNIHGHFYSAMASLAEATDSLHRTISVTVIADIVIKDNRLLSSALRALELAARNWSPAHPLTSAGYEVLPEPSLQERATDSRHLALYH